MCLFEIPRRLARVGVALLVCVAGCSDSTGPDAGNDQLIDVLVQPHGQPVLDVGADSLPTIACTIDLRLTVRGDAVITLSDAIVLFAVGRNRSVYVDTSSLSRAELRSAWGRDSFQPGDTAFARWSIQAAAPYSVTFRLRYAASDATVRSYDIVHDCGPKPTANSPRPSVTAVDVVGATSSLGPGDTITIAFAASSTVGIWASLVELTGPCTVQQVFPERLKTTVNRQARIAIPRDCALGVPVRVSAYALDGLLEEASRTTTPGFSLVDDEPPDIVVFGSGPGGGSMIPEVRGRYFGGDSIPVLLSAGDNGALSYIVWEIMPFGVRDSIQTDPAGHHAIHRIPLGEGWTGEIDIRFVARDAAGLESTPFLSTPGELLVMPSVNRPVVSATVSGEIRALAYDGRRQAIYLLQSNQRRLTEVSAGNLQEQRSITFADYPTDLAITAGGDSLILAFPLLGALGVIDLTGASLQPVMVPLDSLDASVRQGPATVRALANDKVMIYTEGTAPSAFELRELDLRSGVQRRRTEAPSFSALTTSLDRRAIILNGGSGEFMRYDVDTDAFTGSASAAVYTTAPAVDGSGNTISIAAHIYDATLQEVRQVDAMWGPAGWAPTALSPDGAVLYYAFARWGMVRTSTGDGMIVDRTPLTLDATQLVMAPDGSRVIVVESNYGATSRIAVVDLR